MNPLLASLVLLGTLQAAPKILYFKADPVTVARGEAATLSWSVENANEVRITPDIGTVGAAGTVAVYPTETATYTLTATGEGREETSTVTVTVEAPPPPPSPPPRPAHAAPPPPKPLPEITGERGPAAGMTPPPGRAAGRDFLYTDEVAGFGLYSYVLVPHRPEPASPHYRRCIAIIEAFLKIPEAGELLRYRVKQSDINVTYLPLSSRVSASGDPGARAEKYLAGYDYTRAETLLTRTRQRFYDGPYLVSSLTPLSADTPPDPEKMIFQDLSGVPPKVVALWMESFLNQAAQERFWETNSRDDFLKGLRTFIAAGGEQVTDATSALASIIWIGGRR